MSVKLENYVSEFELIFETPTEYQLSTLIKAIEKQISSKLSMIILYLISESADLILLTSIESK